MKTLRYLVFLSFTLSGSWSYGAEPRPLQAGWEVTLDRGAILEIVVISTERSEGVVRTVILRDRATGSTISARDESDFAWGTADLEVSDGSQRMKLRMGLDFFKDGLAVPVELKIEKDIYRALWDPPACPGSAKAKQRLQAAASRLPVPMLAGMKSLYALSFDDDLDLGTVGAGIELLFPDGLPRTPVAEKRRLKAEEIEALVRQSSK